MTKAKKIKLQNHFSVGAIFWVEKFKADGTITQKLGPFHNLVVDNGLDGLANYSLEEMTRRCHVGTGNTAPTISDTGLDSSLTSTTSVYTAWDFGGSASVGVIAYAYGTRTFSFSIGSVTGNLAEVGLSYNNGPSYTFFNRQLFLDDLGNPTTITVLADEGLRVTAEVRVYSDLTYNDGTDADTFTFDDDGTPEANGWTRYVYGTGWSSGYLAGGRVVYGGGFYSDLYGYGKVTAKLSSASTNDNSGTTPSSVSHDAYVDGSFTRNTTLTWNVARFTGTLRRIYLCTYREGLGSVYPFHAFVLTTPITIVDTEEVIFTFSISWGRYTPATTAAPTTAAPTTV